jgi:hypothetical protein
MDKQKAREILVDILDKDGHVQSKYAQMTSFGRVSLMGTFSAQELEALAWWMQYMTPGLDPKDDFLRLYNYLASVADGNAPWDAKYTEIIDNHAQQVCELGRKIGHELDWHDPDTSYEEDTLAFMRAYKEQVDKLAANLVRAAT